MPTSFISLIIIAVQSGGVPVIEEQILREISCHIQGHLVNTELGLKGRISEFQICIININAYDCIINIVLIILSLS